MPPAPAPQVSVVVLAYGAEPHLGAFVRSVLASVEDSGRVLDLELILVDNGARDAVSVIPADPRIVLVSPAANLGFAGGCNAGAAIARGPVLVFVNSDAVVAPDAVHALIAPLSDTTTGLVTGAVRLADEPELMNTVGNPVHYLGFAWAGGFGEPHEQHASRADVTSVSGAFFAVRRSLWEELGGFDEHFFAYHEDTELSLRVWQRGLRVRYEPSAVAYHHYEFSRNATKQFLVERNRWITVLTVFPTRVLIGILPALLLFEVPLCGLALKQGWLSDKFRSYGWLLAHRGYLRQRRSQVQRAYRIAAADFCRLLSARIEPAMVERPPGFGLLNVVLRLYWFAVRQLAGLR